MKKIRIIISTFIFIMMLVSISNNVFASYYGPSYIAMAPSTSLDGQQRNYTAGTYGISMYPTSFYGALYCDIYIDLYKKDLIGKTFLAGDEEVMSPINTTYSFSRGYHPAYNNVYYYFSLVTGGLLADQVYMYS